MLKQLATFRSDWLLTKIRLCSHDKMIQLQKVNNAYELFSEVNVN